MAVYFIGGSPCSGKSTIALALSAKYGLHYFKVDDHLDRYMSMAVMDGKECCTGVEKMTADQIWMREPGIQCEEELMIYEEIFDYILADLDKLDGRNGIITEGAAYLPLLARRRHIPVNRYLSLTPTKGFQVFHYRKRAWVPHVLAECSDQAKAFENWMDRDALFAEAVQQQCHETGYRSLINCGEIPVEDLTRQAAAHFGFG